MKAITVEKVGNNYRVNPNGTAPSTPPDTAMSDVSTNAVQNKVIKAYVDEHAPVEPDIEMSDVSTNAVQNKIIKAYIDGHAPTAPDTSMSDVSTNTVQNKVIKSYVDEHAPTAPDTSMSSTSTNAVQNKVIKSYVDNQISALREELIAIINAIPGIAVSDTAPSDTSKVWIDTGAN